MKIEESSSNFDWLIEWCFMPLSTIFQSYHGDSSHYSCLSWVSPVVGWALKCLAQGHSHEKLQSNQYSLNPEPLDYESNTLPLSYAGLLHTPNHSFWGIMNPAHKTHFPRDQTCLKRGDKGRTFRWNLLQSFEWFQSRRFFEDFIRCHIQKISPCPQNPRLQGIKISRQNLIKVHQRNIPEIFEWKSFQPFILEKKMKSILKDGCTQDGHNTMTQTLLASGAKNKNCW